MNKGSESPASLSVKTLDCQRVSSDCLEGLKIEGARDTSTWWCVFQGSRNSRPRVGVFSHSLERYEHFSLSHWDGLLLAACADARVTRLDSEDMQHDGAKTINTFNRWESSARD